MEHTKISIGIIEDDRVIRTNVEKYISYVEEVESTYAFTSVEAYLKAWTVDRDMKLDVLLLDIGLPGMSGMEALPLIDRPASLHLLLPPLVAPGGRPPHLGYCTGGTFASTLDRFSPSVPRDRRVGFHEISGAEVCPGRRKDR